ncbi:hypothetical protein K3727_10885 [Rhodobacteraceae bacterium M382]|nr:hypothetical protein K3727_10885 [Rhodobacteraceae bacterium M382]
MFVKPVVLLALLASPALAQGPLPLTYDVFETAVPHVNLDQCPKELPQEQSFCRATLNHDEIHVFAFDQEGENPMIGFATYPFGPLATQLR